MGKEKAAAGKKTVKNVTVRSAKAARPVATAKPAKRPIKPAAPKTKAKPVAKTAAPKSAKPTPAKTANKPANKPATKPGKAAAKAPVAKTSEKPAAALTVALPAKTAKVGAKPEPARKPATSAKRPSVTPVAKGSAVPKPPVLRPVFNGQVAGVLQAARSVASRTNKIVEVQTTRRSHLTAEELAEFRQMLLDKRRELVEDMVNLEGEAKRTGTESGSASSTMPIHMADLGTDTWEQEFTLNLIEKERLIVREIDEALDRIENKTFGTCLATGKAISKARLRVKPWAKYCIEYARKRELGMT